MVDIIAKKRDGHALGAEEISYVVDGAADGSIPDYQLAALLMAICLRGMDDGETTALTLAMAASGKTVDLTAIPGPKVDKHSTGGVGDKTTLVAGPLAAACGVKVAKMSGRGLGHTGGTIDKLEAIPGFGTNLTREAFMQQVERIGIAIAAQGAGLVPADKKLYALRDVTATVGSIPLIAASVMSKKLASGCDAILLDVKVGSGALVAGMEQSVALAQAMVRIGRGAGRPTAALVTDMDTPLGAAVGNGVEVAEAVQVLRGGGPADTRALCLELAAGMLRLGGMGPAEGCLAAATRALDEGRGLAKLRELVAAQGGDVAYIDEPQRLCEAACTMEVPAPGDGYIAGMDARRVGEASVVAGAGRLRKDDAVDETAGLVLCAKTGDAVRRGQPLARLQGADAYKLRAAAQLLGTAWRLAEEPPPPAKLVRARVDENGVTCL